MKKNTIVTLALFLGSFAEAKQGCVKYSCISNNIKIIYSEGSNCSIATNYGIRKNKKFLMNDAAEVQVEKAVLTEEDFKFSLKVDNISHKMIVSTTNKFSKNKNNFSGILIYSLNDKPIKENIVCFEDNK